MSELGSWLKERRKALGLTRDELANRVNCSASLLVKIEGGERQLSQQLAEQLAVQLRIPDAERDEFLRLARPIPSLISSERINNLPAQPTELVGREQVVADVISMITDHRVVTIVGPGGMGKTRLAVGVAHAINDAFADGVCFVDLSKINKAEHVLPTIAHALHIRENSQVSLSQQLVESLAKKNLLLVLDNFEQVIEAAADVSMLVTGCPYLSIIITSRSALSIDGEYIYQIPPLSVPDLRSFKEFDNLDALGNYGSVALFLQRAQAVKSGFSLARDNARTITEICARVEGVPLAIELAAARVKVLAPLAILSRLDTPLKLLVSSNRDRTDRQQTLHGAIEWSYNLLGSLERTLFVRLAVFVGGWTLDAAEQVCAGAGVSQADILDALTHLVDKSLVRQEDGIDEYRFTMLTTIREYALERLLMTGTASVDLLRQQHTYYYLNLVARLTQSSRGNLKQLEELDSEVDNIRQALNHLLSIHANEEFAQLAGYLYLYWWQSGRIQEGSNTLKKALSLNGLSPITQAQVLRGASFLSAMQYHYQEAQHYAEQAVDIYRELRDQQGERETLLILGQILKTRGMYGEAEVALQKAIELPNRGPDSVRFNLLASLSQVVDTYNVQRAIEMKTALLKELDEHQGSFTTSTITTLITLGASHTYLQNYDQAIKIQEQALSLLGNSPNIYLRAYILNHLGVALAPFDVERSEELQLEALKLFFEMGNYEGMVDVVDALGSVRYLQGNLRGALEHWAVTNATRGRIGLEYPLHRRNEQQPIIIDIRNALGNEAALLWERAAARELTSFVRDLLG